MTEIWKPICGYEGLYEVSNFGRIKSLPRHGTYKTPIILRPALRGGYQILCLCKNGKQKTHSVHRLVASAFLENPHGFEEINHKDEDKGNNNACNLEWCDRAYNVNYGERTAKTSHGIRMYSAGGVYIRSFDSIREATRAIKGKCPGNISNVLHGKSKTAYGYIWKREVEI